jgi:hypothetical protein
MEEFNKAYMDFRMDKMGSRKEMENIPGIMRAYGALCCTSTLTQTAWARTSTR